jgi:hypothetical protein
MLADRLATIGIFPERVIQPADYWTRGALFDITKIVPSGSHSGPSPSVLAAMLAKARKRGRSSVWECCFLFSNTTHYSGGFEAPAEAWGRLERRNGGRYGTIAICNTAQNG